MYLEIRGNTQDPYFTYHVQVSHINQNWTPGSQTQWIYMTNFAELWLKLGLAA